MNRMNAEQLTDRIRGLSDLSYLDWVKVRNVMDTAFRVQKGELELQLQLPADDMLERIIRTELE